MKFVFNVFFAITMSVSFLSQASAMTAVEFLDCAGKVLKPLVGNRTNRITQGTLFYDSYTSANYLGVNNNDALAYGPLTGNTLVTLGQLSSFQATKDAGCIPLDREPAFTELNRLRVEGAKLKPFIWDERIANAAQNHAEYMGLRAPGTDPHFEISTSPGFTGVTPLDRILATGGVEYKTASEVASGTPRISLFNMRQLLAAPYHGLAMLTTMEYAGVGYTNYDAARTKTVINFATTSGNPYDYASSEVVMFPCYGVTNILFKTTGDESPAPIPGRNIGTHPIGTPIYIIVRPNSSPTALTISSYSVIEVATGKEVEIVKVLGNSTSDNLSSFQKAILPNAPLKEDTLYRASVSGTNNNVPFTKSCEFRTGTSASLGL